MTTWRQYIERNVAKVLLAYIGTYSVFRNGRLNTTIKITLYKALISYVMTNACPTWENAADAHLLKLQRLQNRVFCAVGNLDKCTLVRELHVTFKINYAYDYIIKLCRTQAVVILNRVNPNVACIEQEEAICRKYV
jgi:hypothetical protein